MSISECQWHTIGCILGTLVVRYDRKWHVNYLSTIIRTPYPCWKGEDGDDENDEFCDWMKWLFHQFLGDSQTWFGAILGGLRCLHGHWQSGYYNSKFESIYVSYFLPIQWIHCHITDFLVNGRQKDRSLTQESVEQPGTQQLCSILTLQ